MIPNYRPLLLTSLFSAVAALCLAGCGSGTDVPTASIPAATTDTAGTAATGSDVSQPVQVRADEPSAATPARPAPEPVAPEVLLTTSMGDIRIRLFPDKSPLTVDNFLANYIDRGFYDQTIFHFVEKDFIIAAGGFSADLQPPSTRAYIASEAHNGLKNRRGTVAMSRDPEHINSANCQFFVNLVDNPSLDHQGRDEDASYGYCVFGEVVQGMDIVDRIAEVPVVDQENFPKCPAENVIIISARRTP